MQTLRDPRWLWGVLVVALVGLGAATLLRSQRARLLRQRVAGDAGHASAGGALAGLADYGAVPDFEFVSQAGDTVRLDDLRGQVWIGDFIFTHCASSCPMMQAQLERIAAALGPDAPVRLVSFSVDPERDTPARLAEYAVAYGADPRRWLFLTGDKQQMRRLVREGFHLAVQDASPEDIAQGAEAVLHSTRFVLVDAQGTIRGYYNGLDEEAVEQLGRDLQRLTSEENS
ncbi:MAG: SCO family protein [Candidatus Krumholzibacteriia bacterium]